VGESVSSGARRTLGTCPVFAKPVGTSFARSRRFREAPEVKTRLSADVFRRKWLEMPVPSSFLSFGNF
jgi:hypothetical protein